MKTMDYREFLHLCSSWKIFPGLLSKTHLTDIFKVCMHTIIIRTETSESLSITYRNTLKIEIDRRQIHRRTLTMREGTS